MIEKDKNMNKRSKTMIVEQHVERKIMYQLHRQRVQNAKSIVNSQAPQRKVKNEAFLKDLCLVEQMACMQRTGFSRTFTKSPEIVHRRTNSNINTQHNRRCDSLDSRQSMIPLNSKSRGLDEVNRLGSYDVPEYVLQRYEHLTVPCDFNLLRKLLRPKIYLNMEIKNAQPLGRIIIQLFTEACPEVVLEFVRVCSSRHYDRFNFTRLFPPLWFEGELVLLNNKTLTVPNIEHDVNVVDHGWGSGILSFPSRYVRGSKCRYMSFSISFKPLSGLNGKRIAFGKVRRGQRILDTIQNYGTKNGNPLKEIVVTDCGVLK